jgi:nitrite reductase (NO-forming)
MTQTISRPVGHASEPEPPPNRSHPHYTLGTLVVLGIVGTLVAVGLAIAALMITASRNSVDDGIVAERVEALLAEGAAVLPVAGAGGDVVPDLTPKAQLPLAPASEINVATAPAMPPPSGRTAQAIVEVEFEVVEGVNTIDLATGTTMETWGYRVLGEPDTGVVAGTPGPVIRARVGDVLRFTITNPAGNTHPHNVDFHAVTGSGGGAEATTVAPGETKTIEVRLLYPGFFMYHCAYGDIPQHISHGMFGGILVDPEQPLQPVDHEWYIVQSEYYTTGRSGQVELDRAAVRDETPTYVVFNGAVGALTGENTLQMAVGERARIYFINAGLNLTSNLHPIGSHWDRVYQEATLFGTPLRGSQTTLVPAGGGTVVELVGYVPATLVLVDHALSRAVDKGAIGLIAVSGEPNHEIFEAFGEDAAGTGGHEMHPPAAEVEGEAVSILPGSSTFQDADAPDEFADTESPADYSVNVLTVPVGTTVTWTNDDTMMHTVTAVDGSFDSGFFDGGETWSYTFEEPGEYEYFCLPHPWMRAKVIVEG